MRRQSVMAVAKSAMADDSADQCRIHDLLISVYESLRVPMQSVPVLQPESRVDFVLARL